MADADAESGPLFSLLTDALRAGPGSPDWQQAVAKLRAEGLAEAEEYRLLVSVREHLESGRDYRSIRAGPGFTRKVLAAIEQHDESAGRRNRWPLANVIAVISALAVVIALAYVGNQLMNRGPAPGPPADTSLQDLEKSYYPTELAAARFDPGNGKPGGAIPSDWRMVGSLGLETGRHGLRPVSEDMPPADSTAIGGALIAPVSVPAEEPFAVEVLYKHLRPSDNLIVQVFVSTKDDFSVEKATSSNELVWLLQADKQKVVAGDGRTVFDQPCGQAKGEVRTVRLIVSQQNAVVLEGGQRLWAGGHGLAAAPRLVGVRFLRLDATKPTDSAAIQSIRVLKR